MNRFARSGEMYFISEKTAIIVIENRIYEFTAGQATIVESKHEQKILEALKDSAEEGAPSEVERRQYRRKSSEA